MILLRAVKTYLAEAWSLPPSLLDPNCPLGNNKLMLLEPTKFWAKRIIV